MLRIRICTKKSYSKSGSNPALSNLNVLKGFQQFYTKNLVYFFNHFSLPFDPKIWDYSTFWRGKIVTNELYGVKWWHFKNFGKIHHLPLVTLFVKHIFYKIENWNFNKIVSISNCYTNFLKKIDCIQPGSWCHNQILK